MTDDTPIPCCANCQFSMVRDNNNSSELKHFSGKERLMFCRRYPPIYPGWGARGVSYFPIVTEDLWCGEFMPVEVMPLPHIPVPEGTTPRGIAEEMKTRQQPSANT